MPLGYKLYYDVDISPKVATDWVFQLNYSVILGLN